MVKIIAIVQVVSSLLLTVIILLQNREGGASGILGGEGVGGSFYTKRGLEKGLFYGTIILALIFFMSALASFFVSVN